MIHTWLDPLYAASLGRHFAYVTSALLAQTYIVKDPSAAVAMATMAAAQWHLEGRSRDLCMEKKTTNSLGGKHRLPVLVGPLPTGRRHHVAIATPSCDHTQVGMAGMRTSIRERNGEPSRCCMQTTGAVDMHSLFKVLAKQGIAFTVVSHGLDGMQLKAAHHLGLNAACLSAPRCLL